MWIKKWWRDPELNWGHKAFQASALPAELSRHTVMSIRINRRFSVKHNLEKQAIVIVTKAAAQSVLQLAFEDR